MDPLSRSMQEVRDQDEARLNLQREVFEDIRPILNTPGISRLLQILRTDKERYDRVASAWYDSVLHPAPIQAQAVKGYIDSLVDMIEDLKKMGEIPGE